MNPPPSPAEAEATQANLLVAQRLARARAELEEAGRSAAPRAGAGNGTPAASPAGKCARDEARPEASAPATILTAILSELVTLSSALAGLQRALERAEARPGMPRLSYREREASARVGVSLRCWQRAVHRGEAPQADIRIGRIKLWSHDRLVAWMAQQAAGREVRR
jgi:hypothetical protein